MDIVMLNSWLAAFAKSGNDGLLTTEANGGKKLAQTNLVKRSLPSLCATPPRFQQPRDKGRPRCIWTRRVPHD